jgi:hypothetical protein
MIKHHKQRRFPELPGFNVLHALAFWLLLYSVVYGVERLTSAETLTSVLAFAERFKTFKTLALDQWYTWISALVARIKSLLFEAFLMMPTLDSEHCYCLQDRSQLLCELKHISFEVYTFYSMCGSLLAWLFCATYCRIFGCPDGLQGYTPISLAYLLGFASCSISTKYLIPLYVLAMPTVISELVIPVTLNYIQVGQYLYEDYVDGLHQDSLLFSLIRFFEHIFRVSLELGRNARESFRQWAAAQGNPGYCFTSVMVR